MNIYLNPGHDKTLDSGAVNTNLNLCECDLAYELAGAVKDYLERQGMHVIIGQRDDLYDVCNEANRWPADYFISLHFNAFNKRASGTETLVSSSLDSLLLGHAIQANVKAALCLPDRGIKERPGLFVLRSTSMPAVLAEICFLDNDSDIRRYLDRRNETARAVAAGIVQFTSQAAAAYAAA